MTRKGVIGEIACIEVNEGNSVTAEVKTDAVNDLVRLKHSWQILHSGIFNANIIPAKLEVSRERYTVIDLRNVHTE